MEKNNFRGILIFLGFISVFISGVLTGASFALKKFDPVNLSIISICLSYGVDVIDTIEESLDFEDEEDSFDSEDG
jgi:hypothetical protein